MTAAKFRVGNEDMRSQVKGMTVFNTTQVDSTKQKMFFGPPLGVQRYDKFKYPVFDKLTQQQLGFFWRPEEVSLQKDRADYQTLNEAQKHIFTSNLKYQRLYVMSSECHVVQVFFFDRFWEDNYLSS